MKLCVFNPDNDLALGNGLEDYCMPKEILKMTEDLKDFPRFWFKPDESIEIFNENKNYSNLEITEVIPWGWNLKLRKALVKSGIPDYLLPTEKDINNIRKLSHRRTGIEILKVLSSDNNYKYKLPFLPQEIFSIEQWEKFKQEAGDAIFKTPWSNSGKGIFWASRMSEADTTSRLLSSIKKFGSVTAEKSLKKVIDFAMLFESDKDSNIEFKGYSLFETDSKGAYVSNFLSSNMSIINSITQFISSEQLNNLKHLLLIHLPSIIGEYKGAFGIDMMVYKELNEYLLNPCIEINFRRTMGRAARDFYDYYCVGKEGVFNVSYSNRNLKHEIKTIAADNPEILIDGKLEKGFKSLTKIEEDSRFCIYSIIY